MTKILILGNSAIANKRVIPAINKLPHINKIEIASIGSSPKLEGKISKVYSSYDEAIKNFDGDLVYISLSNNLHDKYLKEVIKHKFHCIVDKPAILFPDTIKYLKSNNDPKLMIAESIVFKDHPAWNSLIETLDGKDNIFKVIGSFMIPELDKNNFRMSDKFFGGAVNDMGAYAMGMGRWLWNDPPIDIKIGNVEYDEELITSFSLMVDYGNNRTAIGTFGFGYEYINKVTMIGKNAWGEFERVFSAPPDLEITLVGKKNNQSWTRRIAQADTFLIFLEKVVSDINNNYQIDQWFKKIESAYNDHTYLMEQITKWKKI